MTTDKQIIQWIRQYGGAIPPKSLYWFSEIEGNKVTNILVEDELFYNSYNADSSAFPNMRLADENTQIGDII